ncbi:stAR-related lipid transfer protein 4 isoform X1 [Scleropages formosus]|uniref:stAR-related lipid transfer protein 4 isoform X1 n=1 Tax=Scleropages formosus TaxID=113540 RepID=UPI0008780CFE|nr:stAR-related lipid transfer protein 4 isoform X1 [Scleropages formosus]
METFFCLLGCSNSILCAFNNFVCFHRREMGSTPNAGVLSAQLQNTLIGYHNIYIDGWRVAKKTKDVTVWRKASEEFSGFLYKVEGVVEENPNRIIDYIRPGPYRLKWDSLLTSMEIVKIFDEPGCCCLMRYTTAGQLWNIIAPREFIDFSYTTDYQSGLLSCGVSVEYSERQHSFVRGFNHPCGWFCVPAEANKAHSLLTGYIQTDLRGMVPQSAVDTAMASGLTNFFSDLRKALVV